MKILSSAIADWHKLEKWEKEMSFVSRTDIDDILAEAARVYRRDEDDPGETSSLKERRTNFRRHYTGPDGREYGGIAPFRRAFKNYPEPDCVCFFYFRFNEDGNFVCRVYHAEDFGNLNDQIVEFILDARRPNPVLEVRYDPNLVQWHKPSYVAVFLDDPNWELFDIPVADLDYPPSLSLCLPDSGSNLVNYSFFEAENRNVTFERPGTGDPETVRFLACKNHHLIPGTNEQRGIGHPSRDGYKLDIFYRLAIENSDSILTMIVDPGGHNTGPEN